MFRWQRRQAKRHAGKMFFPPSNQGACDNKEVDMLVLTRTTGQQIVIDGSIRVTVLEVKGDRIRIGIDAPPDVRIDRAEVHARRMEFELPLEKGSLVGAG